MLIGKGVKFNAKNLANIDFVNVNPLGWSGDEKIDDLINTLLHNLNTMKSWAVTKERNSTSALVTNYLQVY